VLNDMLADPSAMAAAADVLVDQTAGHDLAERERWAVSQPYQCLDPQGQAAELARSRRARANQYSNAMSAWKATMTTCEHRSMPGRCVYRMAG
jgi:hypothetical protein